MTGANYCPLCGPVCKLNHERLVPISPAPESTPPARVERDLGALAQAARNYLITRSLEDQETLDRLAAEALATHKLGYQQTHIRIADPEYSLIRILRRIADPEVHDLDARSMRREAQEALDAAGLGREWRTDEERGE